MSTAWLEVFREPLFFVAMFMDPRLLILLLVPCIDLAMLAAPLPALVWDDSWVLSGVFFGLGLVAFAVKIVSGAEVFVGFYLWTLSFFLMGAACLSNTICRKQFYESEIQKLRVRPT